MMSDDLYMELFGLKPEDIFPSEQLAIIKRLPSNSGFGSKPPMSRLSKHNRRLRQHDYYSLRCNRINDSAKGYHA